MDFELEKCWKETVSKVEEQFGEGLDLQAILFLIGVQELGQGHGKFKKDEKVELMHIAICSLLEPYGYYSYLGKDKDGWPHFEAKKKLPNLNPAEQEKLMKKAIVDYFKTTPQ